MYYNYEFKRTVHESYVNPSVAIHCDAILVTLIYELFLETGDPFELLAKTSVIYGWIQNIH